MKFNIDVATLYSVAAFVFGASLFAVGFFPLSYSSDERAQFDDLPAQIGAIP